MNSLPLVIVPTFYPGSIIKKLFESINENYEILILDNGDDDYLDKIIKKQIKNKIYHEKLGDIGLGKSFNYALKKYEREFFFITQPDVVLNKDCIENLIAASKKYKNAAILAPITFIDGQYHKYDFYDLPIDKKNKKILKRKRHKHGAFIKIEPSGDFSVEAVNSTAILINKKKIESIGGWDSNFYTYLEDMDLCYRLRLKNYEIIKVINARVNHVGFNSHAIENKEYMNLQRVYNYTISQIYFTKKHYEYKYFIYFFFKKLLKIIMKNLIYVLLLRKKKFNEYFYRLKAFIDYTKKFH